MQLGKFIDLNNAFTVHILKNPLLFSNAILTAFNIPCSPCSFRRYSSETVDTSRHYTGKGVATYPNGDVYDGYFKEGLRHGEVGTYTYNKHGTEEVKDTYKGAWANNDKNGIGVQIYTGVGRYHGYWKDGKRSGEGVMIYENEDVYSGSWKEGKKDGNGTYIFKETGMKYVGTFKNGQMVTGKWLYNNGTYFQGAFDNN